MLVGFVAAVACLFWAGIHLADANQLLDAVTAPEDET